MTHAHETDLPRRPANHVPLTPLSFLPRSARVHPDGVAMVHGRRRFTWAEAFQRCRRLAAALAARGVGRGDTVAVLAPNIPAAWEATYGVPVLGAVLNAINTRLDAETVRFILEHGEAKVLIVDTELSGVAGAALDGMATPPLVVDVDDPEGPGGGRIGTIEYEALLESGDPAFPWRGVEDEWQAIALNYTSGTTGNPKGVVYHHRGAYLNALGNALVWGMRPRPVYLWTLPMFHCNGWCFPWTITALGGTHVCLRRVEADAVWQSIAANGVTHLCGAPVVMNMLNNTPDARVPAFDQQVEMMTAAAPPPASVIARMEARGIRITHVYGLTEVYGPAVVCAWHQEWNGLPLDEQARLKARQGVKYPVLEGLMVADRDTGAAVPSDGETMGEVLMRGNIVMKGYLKNEAATREAFRDGWFHTGDLGVRHPDGYIELRDRAKDIIISGGENISTIEVEGVLYRHPAVLEAAVVARPDAHWGETPCAFVTLREGAAASAEEIIAFCRGHLARFKAPKHVVFGPLPKTSTGKVQKFVLRERAREEQRGA